MSIINDVASNFKISPREVENWSLSDVLRTHATMIESYEKEFYQNLKMQEELEKQKNRR